MREVAANEAQTGFDALLDRVEAGEEIVITRGGRAVARLLPPAPVADSAQAREAADAIRRMSRSATLGGLKIKDLIDEGRR